MGKTREIFGCIKGTLHAKMGMINDRNDKGLTETEEIMKWWSKYRKELYEKVLMSWITMMV